MKKIIMTTMITCSLVLNGFVITEADPSKEELQSAITEQENIKQHAHNMAESARYLGWSEDDELIKTLQEKWKTANTLQEIHQETLKQTILAEQEKRKKEEEARRLEAERIAKQQAEEARWAQKQTQYPVATTVWRQMKSYGWNDAVCAGIMGNMMAEVGGQTLNLKYTANNGSYYGLCQWNKAYKQVWGADLITQCEFLRSTIAYELNTYGKSYNYNSFLNLTDCQTAALVFARSYERCGSGSYGVRQSNAVKAYNYFCSGR